MAEEHYAVIGECRRAVAHPPRGEYRHALLRRAEGGVAQGPAGGAAQVRIEGA